MNDVANQGQVHRGGSRSRQELTVWHNALSKARTPVLELNAKDSPGELKKSL